MSTRKPKGAARQSKKLSLNKQTLKDLAPKKGQDANVRGGAAGSYRACSYAAREGQPC